ncbi:hypothetical protein ACFV7Q_23360 [Streptomyces sp. NPDC059851]|uniref:hypothetical protein n=1 Tax=Streptomyces sp. NPDC059851 TaxID=3346971 RepID=UPI00364CA182
MVEPDEVAAVVAFLVSDHAASTTCADYIVEGAASKRCEPHPGGRPRGLVGSWSWSGGSSMAVSALAQLQHWSGFRTGPALHGTCPRLPPRHESGGARSGRRG